MNGNDVVTLRQDIAVLSNDVKHLAEKVGEQTETLQGREPRLRHLENHCVEGTAWRAGHEKEHGRISEQLGELKSDVKEIKASVSSLNGDNRKAAVKGAAIGGVTLTAIFEAARELIGLLK